MVASDSVGSEDSSMWHQLHTCQGRLPKGGSLAVSVGDVLMIARDDGETSTLAPVRFVLIEGGCKGSTVLQ
jgi:hypothetical protein